MREYKPVTVFKEPYKLSPARLRILKKYAVPPKGVLNPYGCYGCFGW